MKWSLVILLLFTIFSASRAAVAMGFYNDPNNPGKCTVKPDLILSPGDVIKHPDMKCGRIMCGDKGLVHFISCGVQMPPPGCTWGDYVDSSRDHPVCCEKVMIC